MKAVVFAYHNMGAIGIEKLLGHGFSIPLVFTHQDSATENIWFQSVSDLCSRLGINAITPDNPNTTEWIHTIKEIAPDFIFSFYYRHMISTAILSIPRYGSYNLHSSMLPKYRGRCPVNWVIIKGETNTGVSLHEMVEKPDAGAIVCQKQVEIDMADTALTLFHKLEEAAGAMLDECLPTMRTGYFDKTHQDLSLGSYFGGRKPEDGRIDWTKSAREIYNLIRGVTRPYPGAFGYFHDTPVLFWQAAFSEDISAKAGRIIIHERDVLIACGQGCIVPHEIEVDSQVMKDVELFEFFKIHEGDELL